MSDTPRTDEQPAGGPGVDHVRSSAKMVGNDGPEADASAQQATPQADDLIAAWMRSSIGFSPIADTLRQQERELAQLQQRVKELEAETTDLRATVDDYTETLKELGYVLIETDGGACLEAPTDLLATQREKADLCARLEAAERKDNA